MKLVKEHIDFKRHLEPKDAMNVGANTNSLFLKIASISFKEALETKPENAGPLYKKVLKIAAEMFNTDESKILAASKNDELLESDDMEDLFYSKIDFLEANDNVRFASLQGDGLTFKLTQYEGNVIVVENDDDGYIWFILGVLY